MQKYENIFHQLNAIMVAAKQNGIDADKLASALCDMTATMDLPEQTLDYLYSFGSALSNASYQAMKGRSEQRISAMVDSITLLSQASLQTTESAPSKQQTFTSGEVAKLTNLSKNTVNKYFRDGTIKAKQNANSGRWYVGRTDLADYLGTDDFWLFEQFFVDVAELFLSLPAEQINVVFKHLYVGVPCGRN